MYFFLGSQDITHMFHFKVNLQTSLHNILLVVSCNILSSSYSISWFYKIMKNMLNVKINSDCLGFSGLVMTKHCQGYRVERETDTRYIKTLNASNYVAVFK